ncbi:DNA-binding Lrp family transcriptional regulator [Micrococcus aloeverae]
MVTAIVLIKTDKSSIPETAETLAALEGVGSVYSVTGVSRPLHSVRTFCESSVSI